MFSWMPAKKGLTPSDKCRFRETSCKWQRVADETRIPDRNRQIVHKTACLPRPPNQGRNYSGVRCLLENNRQRASRPGQFCGTGLPVNVADKHHGVLTDSVIEFRWHYAIQTCAMTTRTATRIALHVKSCCAIPWPLARPANPLPLLRQPTAGPYNVLVQRRTVSTF